MIEIPLVHGTIWINPRLVASIESATTAEDDKDGCYFTLQNGNGWNSSLSPRELAEKVIAAKG